ncbi:MAG: sensor histidine kinase, partial [Steroidobacteraceae bacterium]
TERRHATALLESVHMAQQNLLAHDLHQERSLREHVEDENSQALRFKDALVHEVNHRTKNTLQAAASLLSLHARSTTSAQVRAALLDGQNRLQLLAKAHELLYLDPDNTQSILMPQLLHTLGDALRHSFAEQSAHVSLEITSDPITLPVGAAIPIALIANEAVTNAYKHAFPRDSLGQVTVHLEHTPDNALVLKVADTGVGLHPGGAHGGMGFNLIRLLAAQLHGTLELAGQAERGGTVITLTIERLPHSTVWRLTGSPEHVHQKP